MAYNSVAPRVEWQICTPTGPKNQVYPVSTGQCPLFLHSCIFTDRDGTGGPCSQEPIPPPLALTCRTTSMFTHYAGTKGDDYLHGPVLHRDSSSTEDTRNKSHAPLGWVRKWSYLSRVRTWWTYMCWPGILCLGTMSDRDPPVQQRWNDFEWVDSTPSRLTLYTVKLLNKCSPLSSS